MAGVRAMLVTLKKFCLEDLPQHRTWAKAIDAKGYMSRIYPKRFDGHQTNDPHYRWFIIVYNGIDTGTVWLEKDNLEDTVAHLGILIGREDLFGKGIGRAAIQSVVAESKFETAIKTVRLNVRAGNVRAQACYRACGFRETGRGVKMSDTGESIEFYTMEKAFLQGGENGRVLDSV